MDQGIINTERKYNSDNLSDLKTIWYKLKDDNIFNIQCAILILIYESLSTLKHSNNYLSYTQEQMAMVFTKYYSIANLPNDYGLECAEWYKIINRYNN